MQNYRIFILINDASLADKLILFRIKNLFLPLKFVVVWCSTSKKKKNIRIDETDFEELMGGNQAPADDLVCGWVLRLSHPHDLKSLSKTVTKGQLLALTKSVGVREAVQKIVKMHVRLERKCCSMYQCTTNNQ